MSSRFKELLKRQTHNCIKTNVKLFDDLIGGGIPKGKILELVGEPDIGKTTFLFDIIENSKDKDIIIAYIATSTKSLGFLIARKLDKNENLLLCVSNDENRIINFVKETINVVDLFIIDSIPEILTENERDDFNLNINQDVPKLLSELNTILYGEDSALIAVNHTIFKNEETD